jgi:hypothetical protein
MINCIIWPNGNDLLTGKNVLDDEVSQNFSHCSIVSDASEWDDAKG